jgi:hypothetical protein
MKQKQPQLDPMISTAELLRQEAIAVHARLEALQAFMRRQRENTPVRWSEPAAVLECRVEQSSSSSQGDPYI